MRQISSPLSSARCCGRRPIVYIIYVLPAARPTDNRTVNHTVLNDKLTLPAKRVTVTHGHFTCASCPVMAASRSRPNLSIFFVCLRYIREFLGVITWAALVSAAGRAKADKVRFQPRLDFDHGDSQCLRLYQERKIDGAIPPVDIRGMHSDFEDLWLLT